MLTPQYAFHTIEEMGAEVVRLLEAGEQNTALLALNEFLVTWLTGTFYSNDEHRNNVLRSDICAMVYATWRNTKAANATGAESTTWREAVRTDHVRRLEDYLRLQLERRDWHGVSDAANDLRVVEAELETFRRQRKGLLPQQSGNPKD